MQVARKGYVYRFLDENLNILYVGKTIDMEKRMKVHFSPKSHKAHTDLYEKIHKIEYINCKTEYDALVKELHYINYYKPPYNKDAKIKQIIRSNEKDVWKTYKIIRPISKQKEFENSFRQKVLPAVILLFFIGTLFLGLISQ